jgi:hypothetical protein
VQELAGKAKAGKLQPAVTYHFLPYSSVLEFSFLACFVGVCWWQLHNIEPWDVRPFRIQVRIFAFTHPYVYLQ